MKQSNPTPDDDTMGCFWGLVNIVILCFVFASITDVLFKTATILDQIICYGTLAFLVIAAISAFFSESNARERRSGTSTEVPILKRYGGTWDGGDQIHSAYWLDLKVEPGQIVHVRINAHLYEKLANRNTVRIIYSPGNPPTVLIAE